MVAIGTVYFAAVDAGDVYNPGIHSVEDEEVFSIQIDHSEGQFATCEVEIQNPSEGLLSPSRKKRVFISIENGGSPKLLFSGRITGSPSDLATETIVITYIGQPEDWESVQDVFLQAEKVDPLYNELFIPPDRRNNSEEILAARPELLHWDRATNALSLSNIIEGGTLLDIGGEFMFDTLRTDLGDPPVNAVDINIEVQWEQQGAGTVDCGEAIVAEFTNTGGAPSPQINSLTPLAFEAAWRGARIPLGYTLEESSIDPVADDFGLVQANLRSDIVTVNAADFPTSGGGVLGTRDVSVPRVWYNGKFILQAEYRQKRRENLLATLAADTQDFSLKGDQRETVAIRLQSPILEVNGAILDVTEPSFFYDIVGDVLTTEGAKVVNNAYLRARAILVKRARVVETRFEAPLEDVIDIQCDHSLRIVDDRLPGGALRGKVLSYSFRVDGDSGQQVAQISLGSVIGTGLDSTGSGLPSETQIATEVFDNEFGAGTMTSAIFYDFASTPAISEPIDVSQMEVDDQFLIDLVTVDNPGQAQKDGFLARNVVSPQFGDGRIDTELEDNPTAITIDLKSMNPSKELAADITLATFSMTLPKQVDLEAT